MTVSSSFNEVYKANFKCKLDKNPSKSLLKYLQMVSEKSNPPSPTSSVWLSKIF